MGGRAKLVIVFILSSLCIFSSSICTFRLYFLKVHIEEEKIHSEDNINTMTNLALPPMSHVSPPSISEDNENNLTLPPSSYEQPSTCKDNKSKMFFKCSYCEYESPYKGNLKTHLKKKHEKI